jgi:glycosyltransferase involved in cell wall biosynthesis
LKPNAALQFHPEGFETAGPKPMGRQAAGQGLLRGFVEHADVDAFIGYGAQARIGEAFAAAVRGAGGVRPVRWATPIALDPVIAAGALHLAGPEITEAAWTRRSVGPRAYSLTGVTHTVASDRAMRSITELLAGPVETWDALICTSRSVRSMVEVLLEDQAEYLRSRFGRDATITRPQLPVIPLGVRSADFAPDAAKRNRVRSRLGLGQDDVLFLMAGRLSFHAKAHPHPMYRALQRAAETTGSRPHLLLASWFANPGQERVFREGAAALCPDVTLHVLDGREPGLWSAVWQAADAYTLLSDNIQESFGLAPVEAMASGLPVVGADWDGLRDTVEPGVTGFLAKTCLPPAGSGEILARNYAGSALTYDQYVGAVAQSTAVDIGEAAAGYAALLGDKALRRRMGEAGRHRARSEYDWSVVIAGYQALWTDLAARRGVDAESASRRSDAPSDPAHSDPFLHFAAHASVILSDSDVVEVEPDLPDRAAALAALDGAVVVPAALHTGVALQAFARRASSAGSVGELLARDATQADRSRSERTLLWLLKHGAVRLRARADASQPAARAEVSISL